MKENYERITRVQSVHQNSTGQGSSSELQIPEELKFRVVMHVCLSVCLSILYFCACLSIHCLHAMCLGLAHAIVDFGVILIMHSLNYGQHYMDHLVMRNEPLK